MKGERENNYANKAENEALDTDTHTHTHMLALLWVYIRRERKENFDEREATT